LREQSQVEARSMGLPAGKVDEYNMMSTHPRTVDRVREAQAAAAELRPTKPRVAREEYLARIDGLLFGDDPQQGIVVGQRFVHPKMRFEFTVPDGFRLQNSSERVVAKDRAGAAVVFDIAPARSRPMVSYVAREWAPKAKVNQLEAVRVNGIPGATGWAAASSGGKPIMLRLLALERDAGSAYRLMYIAPKQRMGSLDEAFRRSAYSFRTLSAAEAAAVKPLRLTVRQATSRDRVRQLSHGLPYGELNPEWFRVLNDLPPGAEPKPRQSIKVISV